MFPESPSCFDVRQLSKTYVSVSAVKMPPRPSHGCLSSFREDALTVTGRSGFRGKTESHQGRSVVPAHGWAPGEAGSSSGS